MPSGNIDELMDLRETWKTEAQKAAKVENSAEMVELKEKVEKLERDLAEKTKSDLETKSKLETTLNNHDELKEKLNSEIKVGLLDLAIVIIARGRHSVLVSRPNPEIRD